MGLKFVGMFLFSLTISNGYTETASVVRRSEFRVGHHRKTDPKSPVLLNTHSTLSDPYTNRTMICIGLLDADFQLTTASRGESGLKYYGPRVQNAIASLIQAYDCENSEELLEETRTLVNWFPREVSAKSSFCYAQLLKHRMLPKEILGFSIIEYRTVELMVQNNCGIDGAFSPRRTQIYVNHLIISQTRT